MHGMILVEADRIPKEQFLEQFAELCLHLVEAATILGFKPLGSLEAMHKSFGGPRGGLQILLCGFCQEA